VKPDEKKANNLKRLAKKHGISLILVFGSVVSGHRHTGSDLDVAVLLEKDRDPSYREYSDLLQKLQEIFPGQPLDLSLINHADPLFLKKITENSYILYGSMRKFQELKIYAFKRYQDHRYYFDIEQNYVKRFLSRIEVPL
jgi:predicted nucleotidyltransferase